MYNEGRDILLAVLKRGENYGAEPFVIAADVYANRERYGEAGWSWYTGSAGWFYRAALEGLAGMSLAPGEPKLPQNGGVEVKTPGESGMFTKNLPAKKV